MADEYNSTCNWWDSSRNRFDTTGSSSSSTALNSFSWPSEMVDVKASGSSIGSDQHNKQTHHDSGSELHVMNLGLSSPAVDWNHALLSRGENKHESSFRSMLQENLNLSSNYHHQEQESSGAGYQRGFSNSLDQPLFSPHGSSSDSTVTCQGLQSGFQIDSNPLYGTPSTMLQGLLGSDSQQQPQQHSINYSYGANFCISSNELDWPKVPQFLRNSPPKQTPQSQLHFSNNATFWNASATSINDVRQSFFNPIQPPLNFEEKPKNTSQVRDSSTIAKKSGNEAATKRPRNETASPVPPFKVRKEKMGDRITALQQLVSPFGKTDTASVLSEAIEYIKFLHEQVTVLSSPYMKSAASLSQQQGCKEEGEKQDLRSRGLCVVPLTSTFPVTHETTVDIWSPTFGGFR